MNIIILSISWYIGVYLSITLHDVRYTAKNLQAEPIRIEYNIDSAMCYGVVSSWMKINYCNSIVF